MKQHVTAQEQENTHSMDIYSKTHIPLSKVTNHDMSVTRAINAVVASENLHDNNTN